MRGLPRLGSVSREGEPVIGLKRHRLELEVEDADGRMAELPDPAMVEAHVVRLPKEPAALAKTGESLVRKCPQRRAVRRYARLCSRHR